jgi:hypothetical protein
LNFTGLRVGKTICRGSFPNIGPKAVSRWHISADFGFFKRLDMALGKSAGNASAEFKAPHLDLTDFWALHF